MAETVWKFSGKREGLSRNFYYSWKSRIQTNVVFCRTLVHGTVLPPPPQLSTFGLESKPVK